MICTFSQLFHR